MSTVIGWVKNKFASPKRAAGAPPAPASASTAALSVPWPSDWHGEPFGGIAAADFNFPCVSAACASKWHGKGTPCRPFRDLAYRGRNCAWQRMCSECHECGSPLWSPAATQPAPAPAVDPLSPGAIEMWETMSDDD